MSALLNSCDLISGLNDFFHSLLFCLTQFIVHVVHVLAFFIHLEQLIPQENNFIFLADDIAHMTLHLSSILLLHQLYSLHLSILLVLCMREISCLLTGLEVYKLSLLIYKRKQAIDIV